MSKVRTGGVKKDVFASFYACIKNLFLAWDVPIINNITSLLQKIMKSWCPHSGKHTLCLKSGFSLLSNNHTYACQIQQEEYYNKLESSMTLVDVEKVMVQ